MTGLVICPESGASEKSWFVHLEGVAIVRLVSKKMTCDPSQDRGESWRDPVFTK